MTLTQAVVAKAKALGADLVGIAPVERFSNAPLRMSPQGLMPEAKCVLVMAIHHTDASVELGGDPTPHDQGPYGTQGSVMNPKLDDLSFLLARFLESKGCKALPIVSSNIWRYYGYKDLKVNFAPDLAHRYAAVAAGLGVIGWSGLFLTPEFGPRQRLVSVITDAPLAATPMYDGPALCDRCMACVKHCPTDAFRKEVKRMNRIEIGGKTFQFPEINKWRCSWAENFCLDLAHKIPDALNEEVCLKYLEKYGPHGGEEGSCLKFCMVPKRRYEDAAYCSGPRRKKDRHVLSAAAKVRRIKTIGLAGGMDEVLIASATRVAQSRRVHPALHLPDAKTVILVSVKTPRGKAMNKEMATALERRLMFTAWEISHALDLCGDEAVSATHIPDMEVARALGVLRPETFYATVLTSARLPASQAAAKPLSKPADDELRSFCREAGADLVGFFSAARFERFRRAVAGLLPRSNVRETVRDANYIYGPYWPEVVSENMALTAPEDWLDGAKSVIVLGLHFPHAALDTAKVNPAESIGPYAFVQFETLSLLGDAAVQIIKRLERGGFRATLTCDLTQQASKVKSSRGMLPDMRANLHAAMLAGLACPGVHGHPLTPEFGVRQRFISIVTDCPLPDDPLLKGAPACDSCAKPCIEACPMEAIGRNPNAITLEKAAFNLGCIDSYACDWAKRYCLNSEEGPRYMGVETTQPLPKKRTVEELAAAVSRVDLGVQKRHLDVAEECLRVCPAHVINRER